MSAIALPKIYFCLRSRKKNYIQKLLGVINMKFNPNTNDVHPSGCDCGLCESVEPATWNQVLSVVRDVVLLLIVLAAGYFFLVAQIVIP